MFTELERLQLDVSLKLISELAHVAASAVRVGSDTSFRNYLKEMTDAGKDVDNILRASLGRYERGQAA
jgi:hypothetical protein